MILLMVNFDFLSIVTYRLNKFRAIHHSKAQDFNLFCFLSQSNQIFWKISYWNNQIVSNLTVTVDFKSSSSQISQNFWKKLTSTKI